MKLALHAVVPHRPDVVIGGINHGDNSAVNVHYSGTMGVVIEGFEVIDKIAALPTDGNDRPITDVRIKVRILSE